jgi:hypothetical protein
MFAMRLWLYLGGALLMASITQSAQACRYLAMPGERIDRAFRSDTIAAVVLARVERAAYTGERGHDWHPWSGSARFVRLLSGKTIARRFELYRSGSSAACDDGVPVPKSGDLWVIYVKKQPIPRDMGNYAPLTYPVDWLRKHTGSIRTRP